MSEAVVLGTAQDGGLPHPGCCCRHCLAARRDPARARRVACLGLISDSGRAFLVDATPDFRAQAPELPDLSGILLTHAHMGHIAGLLFLGKEAMAVEKLPVWLGPRLFDHLEANEPWSTLIRDRRILPHIFRPGEVVHLDEDLEVTPIPVPHRDEWSETFGYRISGRLRTVLWLPDIDFFTADSLTRLLTDVDVALIDGTFYSADELPHRDSAEVPHPPVVDTMVLLSGLAPSAEIGFVHLNHTNPLNDPDSEESHALPDTCRVAVEGRRIAL